MSTSDPLPLPVQVAAWLSGPGASTPGVSAAALTAPDTTTGVSLLQQILGRAQSNIVWATNAGAPLCAWLKPRQL